MRRWTRRYLTRRRGIDPPDVEETRQQELKRLRQKPPCPTKSELEDGPHDKRT